MRVMQNAHVGDLYPVQTLIQEGFLHALHAEHSSAELTTDVPKQQTHQCIDQPQMTQNRPDISQKCNTEALVLLANQH